MKVLTQSSRQRVGRVLAKAGVDISTFQVREPFYQAFDATFTLGWGNCFIREEFQGEQEDMIQMFTQLFRAFSSYRRGEDYAGIRNLRFHWLYQFMNATQVLNWQKIRARYFSEIHYELPQDHLFVPMLGRTRAYSSKLGIPGITSLDKGQDAKFDLFIKKLGLKSGDTVIEFGCGAGSFGEFAGRRGIQVIGLNICNEQLRYAREHNNIDTPAIYLNFNLVTQTAQELSNILWERYGIDKVDAALFVGSIEHVGWKNYTNLFSKLHSLLKKDGLMLVHTIGSYQPLPVADPYIMTKIFPDSQLAVASELMKAAEKAGFHLGDCHNLEKELHSYAKTLRCWLYNFKENWDEIKPHMPHTDKEAFYREWIFYLMLCIGAFEADNFIYVGHYVFQRTDDPHLYTPVR